VNASPLALAGSSPGAAPARSARPRLRIELALVVPIVSMSDGTSFDVSASNTASSAVITLATMPASTPSARAISSRSSSCSRPCTRVGPSSTSGTALKRAASTPALCSRASADLSDSAAARSALVSMLLICIVLNADAALVACSRRRWPVALPNMASATRRRCAASGLPLLRILSASKSRLSTAFADSTCVATVSGDAPVAVVVAPS
jgi:hypothetical protein